MWLYPLKINRCMIQNWLKLTCRFPTSRSKCLRSRLVAFQNKHMCSMGADTHTKRPCVGTYRWRDYLKHNGTLVTVKSYRSSSPADTADLQLDPELSNTNWRSSTKTSYPNRWHTHFESRTNIVLDSNKKRHQEFFLFALLVCRKDWNWLWMSCPCLKAQLQLGWLYEFVIFNSTKNLHCRFSTVLLLQSCSV